MDMQHWWDAVAARRDRAQALRIVGLSPKLAPLSWDKLTETARDWLAHLLVVSEIEDENMASVNQTSVQPSTEQDTLADCGEPTQLPSSL